MKQTFRAKPSSQPHKEVARFLQRVPLGRSPLGPWSQAAWVSILVLHLIVSVTVGTLLSLPMPQFLPLSHQDDMSPASTLPWTHNTPSWKWSCHFKAVSPFYSAGFSICMLLASWILFLPHFRKLRSPIAACNTKQIKALLVASRDPSLQQPLLEHTYQPLARNPHLSSQE